MQSRFSLFKVRLVVITLLLLLPTISYSQTTQSKGGISGIKTIHNRPERIAKLMPALRETSGLVVFNGTMWTLNDGGNTNRIYQIDTISGEIIRSVTIINSANTDWEAITQDDSTIYIGDFGNNFGNRKDLRILKVSKSDIIKSSTDTLLAGFIYFSFPDQLSFSPALNNTNFDTEAFICFNDSLHLFSKCWLDQQTRHYILPLDTGRYQARYVDSFKSNGLITDASVNENGDIVLLGYKNTRGKFWKCFLWVLSGYENFHFFEGNVTRIELGSALRIGQSEGIALDGNGSAWITSEGILRQCFLHKGKLFRMDVAKYFISQE